MTTSTDDSLPATPPDLAGLRAQLQALLQWQVQQSGVDAPAIDAGQITAELAAFSMNRGAAWADEQRTLWQRVQTALARQLAMQQPYPLHEAIAPRVALDNRMPARRRGPLGLDLAAVLRHPECVLDEPDELDLAIRYWEAARRALPDVDLDFGNFWRDFEWAALAWHLGRLAAHAAPDRRLLAHVVRTATRYIELKPLTLLIDADGLLSDGFTLR